MSNCILNENIIITIIIIKRRVKITLRDFKNNLKKSEINDSQMKSNWDRTRHVDSSKRKVSKMSRVPIIIMQTQCWINLKYK